MRPYRWLGIFLIVLLSACGHHRPTKLNDASLNQWSGRLFIRIEKLPVESWIVSFDLQGSLSAGNLILSGPLGQVLAHAQWSETQAELFQQGHEVQRFENLNQLWVSLTKVELNLATLFAWLEKRELLWLPSNWSADIDKDKPNRLRLIRSASEIEPSIRLDLTTD